MNVKVKVLVTLPCPTLCNPMNHSPPGSSVHGILQARILEWIAISFSRDLPDPGVKPTSPAMADEIFITEPSEKPKELLSHEKE